MMITRKHGSAGFTMLEVLISIVIIAFGLLGIAGLQAFALKNNHSASLRLTATSLAADMIDRMKTNVTGVSNNLYHAPDAAAYTAGTANGCTTSICDPAQMAQQDLFEWSQKVALALPGGRAVVCVDSTPADGTAPGAAECDNAGVVGFVIKIWWTDHRGRNLAAVKGGPAPEVQLFWTAFNP